MINNTYLNFIDITENEYFNRINNYLENFHYIMNQNIEVFHPKISYLIFKYKDYIVNIYKKIKYSLIVNIPLKKEKFSVINDIYKFILNYNRKYKMNINIHSIIQGDADDMSIIN